MSTPTVTPVKISQVELLREWLKAGKTKGQHVNYFVFSKFATEYMTYINQGRHIPAGFGKHRASRYPNSRYNVVEDGTRDALKAAMLGKRSDYSLRA